VDPHQDLEEELDKSNETQLSSKEICKKTDRALKAKNIGG
jgi:hypothetical protein